MCPWSAIVASSGTQFLSLLCCVSYLVSTEFSEGTDVNVEQDFVEMSDIEYSVERILCHF